MKTLKYILVAVLLGLNLVSCDPPTINEEVGVEEVGIEEINFLDTGEQEDSGEVDDET